MALRKKRSANVRRQYALYMQCGFILALSILITAFRVDFAPETTFSIDVIDQPLIEIDEIPQSEIEDKPPPPPKPSIPVEVPDDELIEDEALDLDTVLDIEEELYITELPELEEEEEEQSEPFHLVEEMPEIIGGMAGILKQIEYPEMAKQAGIEGRVFIQFVVDENGNVVDPKVTRGIGAGCDEVALEAIKKTKFEPGMQRGKAVPVRMTIPVLFSLR